MYVWETRKRNSFKQSASERNSLKEPVNNKDRVVDPPLVLRTSENKSKGNSNSKSKDSYESLVGLSQRPLFA
jgi:hypothetical protein